MKHFIMRLGWKLSPCMCLHTIYSGDNSTISAKIRYAKNVNDIRSESKLFSNIADLLLDYYNYGIANIALFYGIIDVDTEDISASLVSSLILKEITDAVTTEGQLKEKLGISEEVDYSIFMATKDSENDNIFQQIPEFEVIGTVESESGKTLNVYLVKNFEFD